MKKYRILIVADKEFYYADNDYSSYGGTPKEFNALSNIFDLEILVPVWKKKETPGGYEKINHSIVVHRLNTFRYSSALPSIKNIVVAIYRTYSLCKNRGYDVVVCKGPREVGIAGVWGAKFGRCLSVFHYSYNWVPELHINKKSYLSKSFYLVYYHFVWFFRKVFMKRAAKEASLVATVSDEFKTHIASICKISVDEIVLLRTTFTLAKKYFSVPPLQSTKNKKKILFIGRLDKNKNVDTLLSAAKILEESRDDVRFVIVGSGPEKDNLLDFAKEIELIEIEFKGYIMNDQLPDELRECFCLVLPSFSEGFPKVVLEAQAAARPVIASNVGGIPQIIKDGENGFLFSPYNLDELVEKIEAILEDPDMAKRMGVAGRKNAEKFSGEEARRIWLRELSHIVNTCA